MELPQIGQQCDQPACKQLDFLPLICKCGKRFCSDHFSDHAQQCETTVDLHVAEPQKIKDVYVCEHVGCKETSLVPIICNKCGKNFCVVHRHVTGCAPLDEKTVTEFREKVAAPVKQFNEAKSKVDREIEKNLLKAQSGNKSALANKIQLMKIKNKAKGLSSIPATDRVYFNVFHSGNDQGTPVFVAKNWSVGRAIDAIADECKLRNDNHKNTSVKLRVFKKCNGENICMDLAQKIEVLLSNGVILDGDYLEMKYIAL